MRTYVVCNQIYQACDFSGVSLMCIFLKNSGVENLVHEREVILVSFRKGNFYQILMSDTNNVTSFQDVAFDEASCVTVCVDNERTNLTEFELHDLEREFMSGSILHCDNEENEDSEAEVRTHENEPMLIGNENSIIGVSNEDLEFEYIIYYPNLRQSSRETAGRPLNDMDLILTIRM